MTSEISVSVPVADGYKLHIGYPTVADYCNLRAISGLTPVTEEQARLAIPCSWYGIYVTHVESSQAVGMGRLMGGGWYFIVADMAVHPGHQRKGLGDAILKSLLGKIRTDAPKDAYVSMLADAPGRPLYLKNGFREAAPKELGMTLKT